MQLPKYPDSCQNSCQFRTVFSDLGGFPRTLAEWGIFSRYEKIPDLQGFISVFNGAGYQSRTDDLLITNQLLYH